MCSALEDFLSLRVERGDSEFYKHLAHIEVSTISDIDEVASTHTFRPSVTLPAEHTVAIKRLQEFCHDIAVAACNPEELVIAKGLCMGSTPEGAEKL